MKDKQGTVLKTYAEIEEDDLLVNRLFNLSPLALHEEKMGEVASVIVPLEEGMNHVVSERRLMGVRFKSVEEGPRAGAIMQVLRKNEKISRVLLIDRNDRVGTFWVIDNSKEVDFSRDRIE